MQTVNQNTTTTVVSTSTNPSGYGQPVVLTATVATQPSAGRPTGTVTFSEGGTSLGTGTLDANGNAFFGTDTLTLGAHTITASYAGDADFTASSGSVGQQVNQDTTTSLVSTSTNPTVYGQPVTFTATVAAATQPGAGTPTGTVTFRDGGTSLGTAPLAAGVATLTTSALPVGTQYVTATYNGDGNYAGSQTLAGPTSTITTFAGGGVGDGGPATNAAIRPDQIATDADGNLLIPDRPTHPQGGRNYGRYYHRGRQRL